MLSCFQTVVAFSAGLGPAFRYEHWVGMEVLILLVVSDFNIELSINSNLVKSSLKFESLTDTPYLNEFFDHLKRLEITTGKISVVEKFVNSMLKFTKLFKAPVYDEVYNVIFKALNAFKNYLLEFIKCLVSDKNKLTLPAFLCRGKEVLIYKSRNLNNCNNYRTLNLIQFLYRLTMNIIANELHETFVKCLPIEQIAKRKGIYSTFAGMKKKMNLWNLPTTEEEAIKLLMENGVLPKERYCQEGHLMKLYLDQRVQWNCNQRSCRKKIGLRNGTWLGDMKLNFVTVVCFIYCWS
uniref:SPK domain-containing protein n=1 Tax=Strongyloides stercoralis TaxID=6248 RepID=A0A0K0DTT1_STRER